MNFLILLLLPLSTLAFALLAGVFLAFSDFIMRSLSLTSGQGGVEAMQHINREVFRWVFMALFLGMAPLSLVLIGTAWFHLPGTGGALVMLSGLVYLLGCFGVTVLFNVPMNEALARLEPGQGEAQAYWRGTYLPRWTFWNSVRTLACLLSAALLLAALMTLPGLGG